MSVKKIGEVSFVEKSPGEIELKIKSTREVFCVYLGMPRFLPEVNDYKILTIDRIKELAQTKPIPVCRIGTESSFGLEPSSSLLTRRQFFFLYRNNIYRLDREYSPDETLLLIMDCEDKERRKFEKLRKKFELTQQVERQPRRESIPEEVRIAVWRRDGGKCARCGNREKLEYDHIIPISKGGSNTVRNIELLCENCNRKKKNNIR